LSVVVSREAREARGACIERRTNEIQDKLLELDDRIEPLANRVHRLRDRISSVRDDTTLPAVQRRSRLRVLEDEYYGVHERYEVMTQLFTTSGWYLEEGADC
jgi:hypothetical protein